ncbi:uncharacterized protein TRUGW13939_02158 [Talaromyces rugulosus]|uniref:Uncharacterized protein n=1 Tax=Talaromyces rugulosus TaxID=121627 RepID=A0A7H8QMG2_TALRU|nr:uncharacterized protein TRUGW13939_02158 [Talaromyces rugulosus]QKX55066.1 hypothetical protein TRUGW13939_02158 [Talaromyces rugulosus]
MKIPHTYPLITLLSLSSSTLAAKSKSTATFDTAYDDPSLSLSTVTCSDGEHGLVTKNFKVISDLPTRNVGGSPTVKGWNDPNCGACYALTYNGSKPVHVLAIDSAVGQFNLAPSVLNELTGGNAEEFGSVDVEYELVNARECGMPAK